MAITGGFGVRIDVNRGISRRWYRDHAGRPRWLDDDQPVADCPAGSTIPEPPKQSPLAIQRAMGNAIEHED